MSLSDLDKEIISILREEKKLLFDEKLQLIKTFSPSRTRSGPIIKIYKVRNI